MRNRYLNILWHQEPTPSSIVSGFGELKADTLPISEIAKNRKLASEMVDRTRLNDGPSS